VVSPLRAVTRLFAVALLTLAVSGAVTVLPPAPPASAAAASFADAVLSEAARHQGKPYRYGATGPDSFDCSGFTGFVYRQFGVHLPRTSDQQYNALPKVANSDKQPGDLVFTYNSGGIYHVGIYAGNNRMWAAPSTGDHVRVQTIWTSQYKVARPVHRLTQQHWVAHGGQRGFLGQATTGEGRTADGHGAYNHYQGGSIFWSPSTGARESHGLIREAWARQGWERGTLGYPVTDEHGSSDGVGRYNHFRGRGGEGSVFYSPGTGAHAVWGLVRQRWIALGAERGPLGYPVTDETRSTDGVGSYNHFRGRGGDGSIFYSPSTGAHAVWGEIRRTWVRLGAERGAVGYPTSSEQRAADGRGSHSEFAGHGAPASIYYSDATGAVSVRGAVRDRWLAEGGVTGWLGYPAAEPATEGDVTRSRFQGGVVEHDRRTGQTTARPLG
jgi:hypothetical protein